MASSFLDLTDPSNLSTPEPGAIDAFGFVKNLNLDTEPPDVDPAFPAVQKETISTYLRLRPQQFMKKFVSTGMNHEPSKIFEIKNPSTLVVDTGKSTINYVFTKILDVNSNQVQVFEETTRPFIEKFLDKHEDSLFFNYGATNSGKTYTMKGSGKNFGIIPRALDFLFVSLEDNIYSQGDIKPYLHCGVVNIPAEEMSILSDLKLCLLAEYNSVIKRDTIISHKSFTSTSSKLSTVKLAPQIPNASSSNPVDTSKLYSVWISFVEVYNEKVYDLFEYADFAKTKKEKKLSSNVSGTYFVKDLTELNVNSADEAYQLYMVGKRRLTMAATRMNPNSSRSHSVFTIRLVCVDARNSTTVTLGCPTRLTFCDLAGTERLVQTGNTGVRLQESGAINLSLMTLIRCIRALRDKQMGQKTIVPYRDSKLTKLLHCFFAQKSHITMIANAHLTPETLEPSIHVLANAAIVNQVVAFERIEPVIPRNSFGANLRKSIKASFSDSSVIPKDNESLNEDLNFTIDFFDPTPKASFSLNSSLSYKDNQDNGERKAEKNEDAQKNDNDEESRKKNDQSGVDDGKREMDEDELGETQGSCDDGYRPLLKLKEDSVENMSEMEKDRLIEHLRYQNSRLKRQRDEIERITMKEIISKASKVHEDERKLIQENHQENIQNLEEITMHRIKSMEENYKARSARMRSEISEKFSQVDKYLAFYSAEISRLEKELRASEDEIERLEEINIQLAVELEEIKEARVTQARVESQVNGITQDLSEMTVQGGQIRDQLSIIHDTKLAFYDELSSEADELKKEISKLKEQLKTKNYEAEERKRHNDKLKVELNEGLKVATSYYGQIETLNNMISDLNENVAEYHGKIEEKRLQNDHLIAENIILQTKITDLEDKQMVMEAEMNQLKAKNEKLSGLQQIKCLTDDTDTASGTSKKSARKKAPRTKRGNDAIKGLNGEDSQIGSESDDIETNAPSKRVTRARKRLEAMATGTGSSGFDPSSHEEDSDSHIFKAPVAPTSMKTRSQKKTLERD